MSDTLLDRLDQSAAFLAAHHCDAKAIDDAKAEIVRLREALQEIADLPGEINPSNYDHDDACELNRQFCYGGSIATTALEQKP